MAQNLKLKSKIWKQFGNQRKFSQAVGIHEVVISNIISGVHTPNDSQKELITKALGIEWDELIKED
ncbi:MAG: helix-turn-helix transcriptional regulator [Deltaproteobacteria bacterium]|nr:helix-turn-helix transcriptional regulator [Deltaproteobacteria bacterium]